MVHIGDTIGDLATVPKSYGFEILLDSHALFNYGYLLHCSLGKTDFRIALLLHRPGTLAIAGTVGVDLDIVVILDTQLVFVD